MIDGIECMPQVYALHTYSLEYCYGTLLILEFDVCTTAHVAVHRKSEREFCEMRQNHTIRSHETALDTRTPIYCYIFIGLDIIFEADRNECENPMRILILHNFQVPAIIKL